MVGAEARTRTEESSLAWLLSSVREDLVANQGHWERAGFHATAVYRLGVWAHHQKGLAGLLANTLYKVLFAFVRNVYSIELPRSAIIGRRLKVPHPVGVIVSHLAHIGDDCKIRQNVTIGGSGTGGKKRMSYAPTLGNGVEVGAGAVIMGGITVGDGARIGPNTIVMTDVPPGATAFAPPAKLMGPLRSSNMTPANAPAANGMDD